MPRRLLLLVLPVPPSHAGSHLGAICVLALNHHDADLAPILVDLAAVEDNVTIEHQIGQVFFRYLAERLGLLRCVDTSEADLVLLALGVEHGNGVAIGHRHHLAGEISPCRA